MRVGIVSDALHYRFDGGGVGPIAPLTAQFEQWALLFREVIVCAPLCSGAPPATHRPYNAHNISLDAVSAAGGNSLRAKVRLAAAVPGWAAAIWRLQRRVDGLHLRCPNNIGIVALALTHRSALPRQAVYTGNWLGYDGEPLTYNWQRRYLREAFRGPVAVYGRWAGEPAKISPTFSPAFSAADWDREEEQIAERLRKLQRSADSRQPIRLVTVGAATPKKNQGCIIRALGELRRRGIDAHLTVCGGGSALGALRESADELGVGDRLTLTGTISHGEVLQHLRSADFMVLASYTEGFSKAIAEAMCLGAVPLLSDVGMHRQITGGAIRGRVFAADDQRELSAIIESLVEAPDTRRAMIVASREYARSLTLESWREHIRRMLEQHWLSRRT